MRPARPGRGRAGPRAAALAPLALLLALGARPAAASSETVRMETIGGGAGRNDYDRGSPPSDQTVVELGLNFHRIFNVDVVTSEVDLVTWLRIVWNDPRLAWNTTDHNGTSVARYWVGEGAGLTEASEIWTPDLELWNLAEPLQSSFINTHASVSPDGSVFWSRPGHLKPICKFEGLEKFPFDTLKCKIEIGSWAYSGKYIDLQPYGETGYSVGGSDTAGESYNEFSLGNVSAYRHNYPPYPGDPYGWPVIMYTLEFERSWEPYVRGYALTQVVLNFIGFACFWLPNQAGERISLTITAMLAAIAADLVVAQELPAASEVTWINNFSMFSLCFATYCVIESVVVLYFFYSSAENLVPLAVVMFRRHRERKRGDAKAASSSKAELNVEGGYASGSSQDGDFAKTVGNEPESLGGSLQSYPSFRPRDADDYKTRREAENNQYWQGVGDIIDEVSRWVVPPLYIILLCTYFIASL